MYNEMLDLVDEKKLPQEDKYTENKRGPEMEPCGTPCVKAANYVSRHTIVLPLTYESTFLSILKYKKKATIDPSHFNRLVIYLSIQYLSVNII